MSFEKSYLWHFSDLNAAFIEHKLQADGFPYNFKLDWHFGHAFDDGLLEIIRMSIKFTSHSINLPGLLIFGSAIWTFRFCCCVSAILHCLRKFIFNHFCLQKKKVCYQQLPHKTCPRWTLLMTRRSLRMDNAWSNVNTRTKDSFSEEFLK